MARFQRNDCILQVISNKQQTLRCKSLNRAVMLWFILRAYNTLSLLSECGELRLPELLVYSEAFSSYDFFLCGEISSSDLGLLLQVLYFTLQFIVTGVLAQDIGMEFSPQELYIVTCMMDEECTGVITFNSFVRWMIDDHLVLD